MAGQQTVQIAGAPAIIAPAGQFLRAQNVVQATNLLQNANLVAAAGKYNFLFLLNQSGHFRINLVEHALRMVGGVSWEQIVKNALFCVHPAGQNVVRTASLPQQVLQFPIQQTIPVQIPIATSNGQTIIQTVHIPIQTVATAMPQAGGLIQTGGQFQIIQPQIAQVGLYKRTEYGISGESGSEGSVFQTRVSYLLNAHNSQIPQQQLAQVITPSGQIQLAQIQPAHAATHGMANFTQNANGTITIQVKQMSSMSINYLCLISFRFFYFKKCL